MTAPRYHRTLGSFWIMASQQDSSQPAVPSIASEVGVILLPPAPASGASGEVAPAAAHSRVNAVLVLLVVGCAFLTASFYARNSDLWFHLASGRLLAHGQYTFGVDPFAYTTAGVYWANHSWLFDLALYAFYGLIGGVGLVILKAAAVAVLACFMLAIHRPGSGLGLPAVCTSLAMLAMAPRLLLQPALVSYLFLGVTLWLLWRQDVRGQVTKTVYWLLPALCALWANLDEWFFLGPVLTGLFWLGERLRGDRQIPGWLVVASALACLLNPHTYHVWSLPPELSVVSWTSGLHKDGRFQAQFASPWPEYVQAARKLNASALAYLALVALGILSFLLHPRSLRSWRLTVWLPFGLLAAWQARFVPFFAVVAGPIAVLNLQDFLIGLAANHSRRSWTAHLAGMGRWATALCLVGLMFAAWMGRLSGYDREERHVAWGIQPDPSLQQAAEVLQFWRGRGLLREEEKVFFLSPEAAHYAAWFAPGEKGFLDHRYPLFAGAVEDYELVCRALEPERFAARPVGPRSPKNWRQVMRDYRLGIVIFHDRDPRRLFSALRRLAADTKEWTLLHVAGNSLIVGWNPAREPDGFASFALDAGRLTFGPPDEIAEHEAPAAPDMGPASLPAGREFLDQLMNPPASTAWESAAATLYLHYFSDSEKAQREAQLRRVLSSYGASLAGAPASPAGIQQAIHQLALSRQLLFPQARSQVLVVREQMGPFFASLTERDPAWPLLAVRLARRAVAANPGDANAWLRLGQAYLVLRNATCERTGEGLLPPLVQLRHIQIVTALEQAIRLDPDLPDLEGAHHELANLYGQINYLDQAFVHQQEELRLTRKAGPRPGETADDFAYRVEYLETDIGKLEKSLRERRDSFAARSRTLEGGRLAQASLALSLGLARQALEESLLPTPAELLGANGIKLELELLLSLGRADEVRTILREATMAANKDRLPYEDLAAPRKPDGAPLYPLPYHLSGYDWLFAVQAAALGDYADARAGLQSLGKALQTTEDRIAGQSRNLERGDRIWLPTLFAAPPLLPLFTAQLLINSQQQRDSLLDTVHLLKAQEADLCVLDGLLALEQGLPLVARKSFIEAEGLGNAAQPTLSTFAGAPIAGTYLGKLGRGQ